MNTIKPICVKKSKIAQTLFTDARTTRNFGIFFKLEVSNLLTVSVTIEPSAETPEPTGETVMMGGKLL
ncbi:hypothetical protein MEO42_18625 [Dolichospermum sp. ST_sed6]|nr:hypothetical protein [Dolichospermum sp. ST_sed6]